MPFVSALNQNCPHTCNSAENPLQLPGALFHLTFPPAAKPVEDVSTLLLTVQSQPCAGDSSWKTFCGLL